MDFLKALGETWDESPGLLKVPVIFFGIAIFLQGILWLIQNDALWNSLGS